MPRSRPSSPLLSRGLRRWLAAATSGLVLLSGLAAPAPAAATTAPSCASGAVSATSLNPPLFYVDTSITPKLMSGYAGYRVTTASARSDLWVRLAGFTGGALGLGAQQPEALPLGSLAAGASTPAFFMLTASGEALTPQNHTVEVYAGKPGTSTARLLCSSGGGFAKVMETIQAQANKVEDIDGDGRIATVSTTSPQLGGTVSVRVEGDTGTIGAGDDLDPNALYMTPTALPDWPAGALRLVHTELRMSPDGTAPPQTSYDLLHKGRVGSSARPYTAVYTFAVTGTTSTATRLYPIQQISSGTQVKHTSTSNFATAIPPIPVAGNPLTVGLTASPATLPAAGGTARYTATVSSSSAGTSTVDDVTVTVPAGATYVPGSARLGGSAVPDPGTAGSALVFLGPFSVRSGAPAVLAFDLALPGTAGRHTATAVGHLADTVLDTTALTTDRAPAEAAVDVAARSPQEITFPALPDTAMDVAAPALQASATSALPVSYTAGPASVCTVRGDSLTLVAPGSCTVTAAQPGDAGWLPATDVSRSFAVLAQRSPQTITFPATGDRALDAGPVQLAATATSGLPVTYATSTPDVCAVTGTTVTLRSTGTCRLTAAQGGSPAWLAAPDEAQALTVLPGAQTVTFDALPGTPVDAPAPALQASASSGLPVSYTAGPAEVCRVTGTALTLLAPGTCTVTAGQPGDASWAAAPDVPRLFAVAARLQTVAFPAPAAARLGEQPALTATATSGLPVGYRSTTPGVCEVDGSTVRLLATGACTVVAAQTGGGTWAAAAEVERSFAVLRRPQTMDFGGLGDTPLGGAAPALAAVPQSRGPVTYTSSTPDTCQVVGSALSLVAPGTCTVLAQQPGDAVWEPVDAVGEFVVLPAGLRRQTITFPALPDTRLDQTAPALAAAASSGLPVTYGTATPTVCTVRDGRLALLSAGTCTLTASQRGDAVFAPAADVPRDLRVLAARTPVPPRPGATVGTAPAAVDLPGVPDGAVLTVPSDAAARVPGVARVQVQGSTVTVVPDRGFSGLITLPVTVQDGDRTTRTAVRVVVSPEPAAKPVRSPSTASATKVAWAPSPNATGYVVRLDGRTVCSTSGTACTVPALLGPKAALEVVALGNDGTRSTVRVPGYRAPRTPIRLASVYFATDSAALSQEATKRLDRMARDLKAQGFGNLVLSGHTDSRGSLRHNERLSERRADAVERYLLKRLGRSATHFNISYHAYKVPAATNRTVEGRAQNRRTDVSLA